MGKWVRICSCAAVFRDTAAFFVITHFGGFLVMLGNEGNDGRQYAAVPMVEVRTLIFRLFFKVFVGDGGRVVFYICDL